MPNPLSKANLQKKNATQPKAQFGRAAILLAAVKLAALKGLANISLGDLAAEIGMSKSGLYAHFETREELEAAIVETAITILDQEVLQPAFKARPGIERLRVVTNAFLSYLERKVFPRGCFIAAVSLELESRPGAACDLVAGALDQWVALLRRCIVEGQDLGEITPNIEVTQVVFEIQAMLFTSNFLFVMSDNVVQLTQARAGVENVVTRIAIGSDPKKNRSKKNERRSGPRRKAAPPALIDAVVASRGITPD